MSVTSEAALRMAHEEPEFLKFGGRGESTLYCTVPNLEKTEKLFAFGGIAVSHYDPLSGRNVEETYYEIHGDEIIANQQRYSSTPIYIREPDYLYMEKSYRTYYDFKDQFDSGKFYRRWRMPPEEPTRVVRHFELFFGKLSTDVYVMFNGDVHHEEKKNVNTKIVYVDIGWGIKSRTPELDSTVALTFYGKDPILLTDDLPEEPEPESELEPEPVTVPEPVPELELESKIKPVPVPEPVHDREPEFEQGYMNSNVQEEHESSDSKEWKPSLEGWQLPSRDRRSDFTKNWGSWRIIIPDDWQKEDTK